MHHHRFNRFGSAFALPHEIRGSLCDVIRAQSVSSPAHANKVMKSRFKSRAPKRTRQRLFTRPPPSSAVPQPCKSAP